MIQSPASNTPSSGKRSTLAEELQARSRAKNSGGLSAEIEASLPPPVKRGNGRIALLFAAGLFVAIVLAWVVLNIDRSDEREKSSEAAKAFGDDIKPPPTGVDDAANIQDMQGDIKFVSTQRGWIQATENGRLAQEYRYARSEPGAAGRLRMEQPEVKIYMANRRVLSLRGVTADVHAPNKVLESGTMKGDVLIRLFELDSDRQLDETIDVPVLEVRTPEASFDNFQGEIRCPGEVDIQTATAHLPAIGLRMQINEVEGRPGQTTIDRINGEVRLSEAVKAPKSSDGDAEHVSDVATDATNAPKSEPSVIDADRIDAAPRRSGEARDAPPSRDDRQRDRARERREARAGTGIKPRPIEEREGPFFYRLTLNKSVRIRQGDGSTGWVATGDQLHMIFSLDSSDLGDSLSRGSQRAQPVAASALAEPMSIEAVIAAMAIALQQDSSLAVSTTAGGLFKPSDTDTIITCEGPLTMVPLVNTAEQPASPDDSRFELVAAGSGWPVILHNNEDQTDIRCATLRYASLSETMELIGSPQHRLVIDSPDLHAECDDRFSVDRRNNVGNFQGGGWMIAGESGDDRTATQPAQPLSERGDVRITWRDGVDLKFEPETEGAKPAAVADAGESAHDSFGRLRLAIFNGAVAVKSPDFTLDAERMGVGFPATRGVAVASDKADARIASIEFIHAERDVVAGSMGDEGSINCQDLIVNFANIGGKTVPLNMVATGEVAAVDREKQTVWADQLDVKFKPAAKIGTTVIAAEPASQPDAKSNRRADVERLTATGGVQIQMADGARVFADRLESDGEGLTIILTGEDVMVVSDRNIINKGRRLELTNRGDNVLWPGPGEFAYYTTPILPQTMASRIVRPTVDLAANPRQMLATWGESMRYDGTYDNGAGSIEIRGNVDARSTPSPLEENTMIASELTLLFAKAETTVPVDPATRPIAPASQPDSSLFAIEQGGRRLKKLIAKGGTTGDAKMESRTWANADRSDKPRVFALSGPHITYDDQTLEAHVVGAGMLVVRDERPEPAPSTQPIPGAGATQRKADLPFGARGTTLFKWSDNLNMTRKDAASSLYDIVLVGGIEVRHRALDNSLSTMTGDQLAATVDRTEGEATRDAGFDLGGSMDLQRIRAQGNVYVDSPTRDVDCDEFDYDYGTGLAQLIARPGRTVTIVTAGNPHPVQAESFQWNTVTDTVVVKKASGSSGR